MNINIKTIPHKDQRYETVGDWIVKNSKLSAIYVSDMNNEDYAFLVGIHELVEAWLCLKKGVTQKEVDEFDMEYEKNRKKGNLSEPGNSPKAPYYLEHKFATKIEKMLAKKLNIDWEKYDKIVINL